MYTKEDGTRQVVLRSLIENYERDLITDALKINFGNKMSLMYGLNISV
jgi:hypothetical protein